ncbi:MAG: cation:proton antiporter [Gammaproteobacteria bacterium]
MHGIAFIQDLAAVLLVAGVVTVVFHRLHQPVVLGYLLAGFIIGPHTPPFPLVRDEETIRILADLGLVFLLFSLGLEFSLKKLRAVGIAALIGALTEIVLMLWVGYEIGLLFGWSGMDSIFLGAMLSISSTTIVVKTLEELKRKQEPFAHLIMGILIVEDILAIGIIALLSGLARSGVLEPLAALTAIGHLGVFLVAAVMIGLLTVPRLIDYVARFNSSEMLLVTVLGLCFGSCLLVAKLDYSIALGAFLMGALIAEAKALPRVERLVEPVRDLFSAIFFVTVGMLIEPRLLIDYAVPIAVITAGVVLGKIATRWLGVFLAGHSGHTALRAGMGLAQIGEFSFIIAALGLSLGVISEFLYPIAVAVAVITTFLTPYLIRGSDRIADGLTRLLPRNVKEFSGLYTRWAGSLVAAGPKGPVRAMLHRSVWIVTINLTLIVALFLGFAYLAKLPMLPLPLASGQSPQMRNTLLWSAAVLISLPLFIATYRKLQAISMVLAELSLPGRLSGELTPTVRALVAQGIPMAALALFGLFTLVLTATILPPREILIALIVLFALLVWWLHRGFLRIYSRLQIALEQKLGTALKGAGPGDGQA